MTNIHNMMKRFSEIFKLEENWDGYKAIPISKETKILIRKFILKLPGKFLDKLYYEDIVPTNHGTVTLEWNRNIDNKEYFVQIELGCNGSGYFAELPNGSKPYNDNLEITLNNIPDEFLNVLDSLYK